MDIVVSVVILIASGLGQSRNILSWGHSEASNGYRKAKQKIIEEMKSEERQVGCAVVAEGVSDSDQLRDRGGL